MPSSFDSFPTGMLSSFDSFPTGMPSSFDSFPTGMPSSFDSFPTGAMPPMPIAGMPLDTGMAGPGQCWANSESDEVYCEKSGFTRVSCIEPRCHWGPADGGHFAGLLNDGFGVVKDLCEKVDHGFP